MISAEVDTRNRSAAESSEIVGTLLNPSNALAEYISQRCVHHASQRRLLSPSGNRRAWLLDLRPAFLNAEMIDCVARLFWQRFEAELPFQIGGMEVAAIPLITALQLKARALGHDVNGFIIRKERKRYATGCRIEGTVTEAPVILVDDIINSGESFENALLAMGSAANQVRRVFAVVDFASTTGLAWRTRRNLGVTALYGLSELGLPGVTRRPPAANAARYDLAWRFGGTDGDPFHMVPKSAPLRVGERIYVGDDAGELHCLNAATGSECWRFRTQARTGKGIWSTPACNGDVVAFGAYDGCVYCLDARDGTLRWVNSASEWVGSSPVLAPELGLLFIGLEYARARSRGSVAAFSLTDGTKIWEHGLPEYQHGSAAYACRAGFVIFGTNGNSVIALDASNGSLRWTFATRGPVKSAPVVDEDRDLVCFSAFDHSIYMVDLQTGALRAEVVTGGLCFSTPLISGGYLVCGSGDRRIYIVDLATLGVAARIDAGARVYASPAQFGDRVCVGTTAGKVLAIELAGFTSQTIARVPDAITNRIATSADGAVLFVGTYVNEVYAFRQVP